MIRRLPRLKSTKTLFPDTTHFRSQHGEKAQKRMDGIGRSDKAGEAREDDKRHHTRLGKGDKIAPVSRQCGLSPPLAGKRAGLVRRAFSACDVDRKSTRLNSSH